MELCFVKGKTQTVTLKPDSWGLRDAARELGEDNAYEVAKAKERVPGLADLFELQNLEGDEKNSKIAKYLSGLSAQEVREFYVVQSETGRANDRYILRYARLLVDPDRLHNDDQRAKVAEEVEGEFWRSQDLRKLEKVVDDFRNPPEKKQSSDR